LNEAFKKLRQLPYVEWGPNSNTYARQLLELAGFEVVPQYKTSIKEKWIDTGDEWVRRGRFITITTRIEIGPTQTWGWKNSDYGGPKYDKFGNLRGDKYKIRTLPPGSGPPVCE